METTTRNDYSLASLVGELRDKATTLVRQEFALAKAEMTDKARKFSRNAVYLAIGGIAAVLALVFILLAVRDLINLGLAAAGLSDTVAIWLSSLIVGVVVGLIAWALIAKGKKALAREGMAPQQTLDTLREDKDWAKEEWSKHRMQRRTA